MNKPISALGPGCVLTRFLNIRSLSSLLLSFAVSRFVLVPLLLSLVFALGCSGFFFDETPATPTTPGSGGSTADYIYVMNQGINGAGTIAGYSLSSGTLTTIADPYPLSYSPTVAYVRPGNDLIYVGSATSSGIYCYHIGSGGTLSSTNDGNAVVSLAPLAMTTDADGTHLAVLLNDFTSVAVYAINTATGGLTLTGTGNAALGGVNGALTFTPDGEYLYVATGTGGLSVFSFAASTGAITDTGGRIAAGSAISFNGVATDTSGGYLLIARSGTGSGVDVHAINGQGQLASGTIHAAQTTPWALAFNSDSSAVYVVNKGSATVSGFSFSSGTLTPLASAASTGTSPIAIAADSSGDYMVVLSSGGAPNLKAFSFNSGLLVEEDAVNATGTGPTAMAVSH